MDKQISKFIDQVALSLAKGVVPTNLSVDKGVVKSMFIFLQMDEKYKQQLYKKFSLCRYKNIYLENISGDKAKIRVRGAAEYYKLYNFNDNTIIDFFIGPYSKPVQILATDR